MNPIVRLIIIVSLAIFESQIVSGEVKSPPYFIKQPSRDEILFYVENEDSSTIRSFDIPCEAKGIPEPHYFYTKNGVIFDWASEGDRITRENGTGTLTISPTKASDVGQYQCFAENTWGIATSNSIFARKVELNSFRNEPPVHKEALEGQPFNLTCHSPGGHPKPSTNWLIQDYTGKLRSITDPRITVDPEGTLWFSSVTLDDEIEDSVYACAVTSPYISEVKTGAKVMLRVTPMNEDSASEEVAPVKQYTSKLEETATVGKKARLYCIFGGTPLPDITWYKNDKLIQFRSGSSSKDGGKSIEIKKVTPSDEGNYTCQASNGVGDPISHTIALKVQVEPRFTKKPENVTIDEQETVEFHCQATGNPTPEIIWMHNGKPLSEAPFNPRRAVSSNSIIIEKLWKNDTGIYGCNATNSVGYVYQEAFVNVLAEPPNITELSKEQEIIEGGTVTMSCRADGSPKPHIIWMRNDAELSGDRFITTKSGNLTIKNAVLADTGEYVCFAQNKISSINATALLSVRNHTEIPPALAPSDTEVPSGNPTTLKCSAVIDDALELNISWKRNGEAIESSDQHFHLNNDGSLTILETSELDSGAYTCVAHTRLDNATAEAMLVIQNIPNPPAIVSVECNAKDAAILWKNTGDNRAPILNYILQYNKISASDMWEVVPNTIPATETSFTVTMTPWTNYTFRVLAVNKIGISLPSESSSICNSSPPEVPYVNPRNVTVQAANDSRALQIFWEPMPKTDHNGPGFHYKVSWKNDVPESEWENQTIPNWEKGEYTIPNLVPFTKYLVKVTSGNDLGQSALVSETLECNTPADIPFKNPDDLTVQTSNSTTLDISWQPMPKKDQNGPGFYYNVSWKEDTPDSEWQSQIITQPEKGAYKVSNVQPYEKYLVTVVSGNDQGLATPPSEPFVLQTLPDVPYKNPENVTISSIDSKTLQVSWEPVPQNDHNGPGFHYNVSWKKDTPEAEWENQTISKWETEEFTIPNLIPHTKYLVNVSTGNDLGQSTSVSETFEYNTPADIPFKNPDDLTVQANNPTSLKISWKPMPKSDQNGPGFYYNISWKKDTPEVEWQSQTITQSEIGEFTVPNVQPFEKYFVTVTSGNDQGPAVSPSEPFIFQTPPDTPYKNPENVNIGATNSTTLQISWMPMPKNDHNGPGFHYDVSWKMDTPEVEWKNQTIPKWETEEFTIPDLIPHTKYLVKVTAGNNLGQSTPVSETFEYNTPADIPFKNPDNLIVQAKNPTSLEISWKPMPKNDQNGPGFYYNVSWKKDTPEAEWQSQTITQSEIGEYVVPNEQPYEKYLVTVTAGNDQGPATSPSIPLVLQTPPDIPYKNPENVTVGATNSTTLQISWKPMPKNNHNGPGFHYNVLWKRDIPGEDSWEYHNISDWETGEYIVHDVLPYEKYLVTVIAGNEIGPANPTSESISFTTPATIPYKNPENVTVQATGPTTSVVSWKPMPKVDHNGPGFYYKVSWKIDVPEEEWESQNISEWETGEYTINIPPYEKHFVTVIAGNDEGQCTQPPIQVEGYYEEGVPTEAPANLTLVKILSSTKANITWERVPKAALGGNFQGYKIETWPEHDQQKGTITETIVEQNFDSVVIDKLTPNAKNKIRILVFNGKHDGPFSEELEINTPEGVPEPVQSAEANPVGSSALLVAWKPPLITNGHLTGYKINYQTVSDAESGPMIESTAQITDPNDTKVKLTDLQPDTNYRIFITATTNAGDGQKMIIEQKTRPMPNLPLIKPEFKLEPTESNNSVDVKVIWLPCGSEADTNCNDQLIGSEFRVDYALKDEPEFHRVVEKNDRNVTIRNLQPNKEYKFMVSSVDGTLVANSTMKIFKTPKIIPKNLIPSYGLEETTVLPESSVPKVEPIKDSGNFTIMWLVILVSIALLAIVLILIAIYLKRLTEGDKYIVREREIKNRRPDWPEDPDFPEVSQPLNQELPVDPSKPDKDGMVMIPLN